MSETIDIRCLHCDAVIRVRRIGWGPDEKKWFDCPSCGKVLFSFDHGTVYDIDRTISSGSQPPPDSG